MSEAKQTRCPHCGSTFRVSDTQMAAKGGNVRCGSCLQVFRADLHMVGAQPPAPAAAPLPPEPAAPAAKSKPRSGGFGEDESWALKLIGDEKLEDFDDDDDFDSPRSRPLNMEQSIEPSWSGGNNTRIRLDDEVSDFDSEADGHLTSDKAEDAVHVISATADESWAQSILSELEQEDKKADHKSKNYGMEVIRDDKPAKAPPRNIRLAAALGEKVDPELLRAAQEGARRPPPAPRTQRPAPGTSSTPRRAPKDDELSFDDEEDALSFLSEDLNLGSAGMPPAPGMPGSGNTFNMSQPLADVEAPVVLGGARRSPIAWKYMVGWGIACLLALALLATQYVYLNFDRLAADPQSRGLLQRVCTPVGIPLPDAPDLSKLKIANLSVRPDPDAGGAVLVDALITNSADFNQPFPALKVSFSDSNDQLVAGRIFQPRDYLLGEAAHLRRIPPDTPVHISLAVINPGTQAVNYSVEPLY